MQLAQVSGGVLLLPLGFFFTSFNIARCALGVIFVGFPLLGKVETVVNSADNLFYSVLMNTQGFSNASVAFSRIMCLLRYWKRCLD